MGRKSLWFGAVLDNLEARGRGASKAVGEWQTAAQTVYLPRQSDSCLFAFRHPRRHFEPSLDALSLRSDVMSSIKGLSLQWTIQPHNPPNPKPYTLHSPVGHRKVDIGAGGGVREAGGNGSTLHPTP